MLKQAILPPIHLITVLAMLRLKDIVSRADLRLLLNGIQVWMPRFQLLQALLDGGYIRGVLQVEFPEPPLVLRLFELLIEHAIGCVAKSHRAEAMIATAAIIEVPAVTTGVGKGAEVAPKGVIAIGAPETLLALEAVRTLGAVPAEQGEVAVEEGLAEVRTVAEVAVPRINHKIAVIAVLGVRRDECGTGNRALELGELIEEGPGKIKLLPLHEGIPVIAPPLPPFVDRERCVLRVHRDDLLPRLTARALVEYALISPNHFPHNHAGKAESTRRHRTNLQQRTDLLPQPCLLVADLERRAAPGVPTGGHERRIASKLSHNSHRSIRTNGPMNDHCPLT